MHTHIGTKKLIEDYITECETSLGVLLNNPITVSPDSDTKIDDYTILDELLRARHAFGRTALLLSGGGTMGMLHIGVIESLIEHGLLPKVISGSSAGAIVAAALCTRTDAEIPGLLLQFPELNLDVFDETGNEETAWTRVARLLKHGRWSDITYLAASMRELLGELTFQEAYNRTRRVLNIPVSSATLYESPRLLNYLTAPNVLIWSAVCASCSVPLIFQSHTLLAKDQRTNLAVPWNPSAQRWIDGSVDSDLPMTRLTEMFNVNHFIVSQVNPHVTPFLRTSVVSKTERMKKCITEIKIKQMKPTQHTHTFLKLLHSETMHRLTQLAELNIMPTVCTRLRSVLAQKYSGDINIMPEVHLSELHKILKNPTVEFLYDTRIRGIKATWPKIELIRNHCAIEMALDKAILELRARAVFSSLKFPLKKKNTEKKIVWREVLGGDASAHPVNDKPISDKTAAVLEDDIFLDAGEILHEQPESESEDYEDQSGNLNKEDTRVMGSFPEDCDFDIGLTPSHSPPSQPSVRNYQSYRHQSAQKTPSHSRSSEQLLAPSLPLAGYSTSYTPSFSPSYTPAYTPSHSPYHSPRMSFSVSYSTRAGFFSQPSTPGPGYFSNADYGNSVSTVARRGGGGTSNHNRNRTFSDAASPRKSHEVESRIKRSKSGTLSPSFNNFSILPPSIDSMQDASTSLSMIRKTQVRERDYYWPLQYESAAADITVPGISTLSTVEDESGSQKQDKQKPNVSWEYIVDVGTDM